MQMTKQELAEIIGAIVEQKLEASNASRAQGTGSRATGPGPASKPAPQAPTFAAVQRVALTDEARATRLRLMRFNDAWAQLFSYEPQLAVAAIAELWQAVKPHIKDLGLLDEALLSITRDDLEKEG